MGIYYETQFSPTTKRGRDFPNSFDANSILDFCSKLQSLPGAQSTDNTFSDIAVRLYRDIQWDLEQICNVLLPRIIQGTNDQAVINALVGLDRAKQNLRNAVIVHEQIVIGGIFHEVITLVKQVHNVYNVLVDTEK